MTGPLTRVIAILAFSLIFAGWTGAAAPARAESQEAAKEPSAKAAETTGTPAPSISEIDLEDNTYRPARYAPPETYTGHKISLDFKDAEIRDIIKYIGEASGKNIIVSEAVSGRATLKLRDVPWDQALDIVLAARNLGIKESGNVLTVHTIPTTQYFQGGRERIAAERSAAINLTPLAKKIFTPKQATVSQVSAELNKLKSERGKIVAIGNDIYVEDEPGAIATMSQIFMRLDRVGRQMLIQARFVEVSDSLAETLDIQWKSGGVKPEEPMKRVEAGGEPESQANGATLAYDLIDKDKNVIFTAALTADETKGDSRTIIAPRIMATNGQKLSIKQGQQTCRGTLGQSSSSPATDVRYKDLLMELEVTPHLEENGQLLTLDLKLTNETPESVPAGAEPTNSVREAQTKLMVKDGETIVIGGLITDNDQGSESGLANGRGQSLSDWLSTDHSNSNKDTELLIFVTATIIPINI